MQKKISIILVNYNGIRFNIDCINSILSQNYQNFEIIFVDNLSTDGSMEQVENHFKEEIVTGKIKIIKSEKNTGFTGGNNLGHKYSNGDYVCLLNNDTTVPNNWLEELVIGIQKDEKLGAVGSLILDRGYEEKIKEMYLINNKKLIITHFGDADIVDSTSEEQINKIYYTNAISGCCIMYKKEIIDFPFPEFYFAYGEEIWLSNVISLKGFKLGICVNSFVSHFGSGSFGKKPNINKVMMGTRNQFMNFILFHSKKEIILLFPLFLFYHLLNSLFNYRIIRILGKLKAIFSFFVNIKQIYSLNFYIKSIKKIDDKKFSSLFSYKLIETSYLFQLGGGTKNILGFVNNLFKLYFDLFRIKRYKN